MEPASTMISLDRLRELFTYDPDTGVLTRRITRAANAKAGDVVGSVDGKGYLHVNIDDRFIRVHRICFFMHHGYLPPLVDHRNRNRKDNRIENLRDASPKQNIANSALLRTNSSGYRGVSRNSKSGKWHAQIKLNGKQTYLGRFDTPEEAYECYKRAAIEHFGEEFIAL
jgi:hypothetical protein